MTPQNAGKDARNEQNFGDQPEKNSERNQTEQARPNQHEQTPRGQYQSGQGRYGLRFENMSTEELEYYRPFWEEKPDPDAVPPELIDHLKVRARRRLVNALSLIAVAVGVTLTLSGMLSGALYLSFPGAFAFGTGIFGWVAVRRRLFAWLRLPGKTGWPHHGCCRSVGDVRPCPMGTATSRRAERRRSLFRSHGKNTTRPIRLCRRLSGGSHTEPDRRQVEGGHPLPSAHREGASLQCAEAHAAQHHAAHAHQPAARA